MNRYLFYISLFLIFILIASGKPSLRLEDNIVPGKLIVQFEHGIPHEIALEEMLKSHADMDLRTERCLSEDLGIWLLSYDADEEKGTGLLLELRRTDMIANAQFEHYISLREVIPDDPEFENQWALKNTGQTGGVPDADIDATDAWEITTNTGTTALGDTIVMAIVDDGFSMSHDDMRYWKNRQEIPNNSIDDDNNGYVDDYDGWNAYYHIGYIQPKDHGQHVAGIAGAIGNNGLGVSGINWNGYVMTVAGSSTQESVVVEAYAYVHKMRSLYDESGGTKGAFVVVMNSSFGVDLGNPDDYPVWGAMYDSLGALGILSPCATTNAPYNVDEEGDIPTTFKSDFVIGVTNTTNADIKNYGAGWGPENIDLGAPGKSIMSTRIPNTYGYKTGTSMAAPQVTGSIGLMYAAADEGFLQTYAEQPAEMAVFIKNLILDGVDTLAGFDTLCVSGGRLNVNNAIQKLINPRIGFTSDTFSVSMGQDHILDTSIIINNFLGFELPYIAVAESVSWLSFANVQDTLSAMASHELEISFDSDGMSLGNYYSNIWIEDVAGMELLHVIEMKVESQADVPEISFPGNIMNYYPNPFNHQINIFFTESLSEEISYRIYALDGKLMLARQLSLNSQQLLGIDGLESIKAGVYLLSVSGADWNESFRIVKSY